MRQAVRQPNRANAKRTRTANTKARTAPIKGWNARDSIANMKPEYAITLENWFPTASDVMVRKGKASHVTGITGQVETLMPYNTPAGKQTLFAAAGTVFHNVTSAGAVGAAVVTGLTNARWQYLNFTNSSGTSYLMCFNGVDSPRYWDGTSWITITGTSTPAITGVTTTGLIGGTIHKRRVWLVEKNTLKAWYLPVDAVGGAANALDLSGIAKKGGYLMAVESWTLDAGEGVDDYWVALTSEGEVIIYKGTDSSSANTWALHGVYQLGEPIGRRCMIKYAGDVLMILKTGVFPLSRALISKTVDPAAALTGNIEQAMSDAASSYSSSFGWELTHYQSGNMVLLNVPVREGSQQQQYVMNTITGAWCKFTGWEGNTFAVLNGALYMGGSTVVERVWYTNADNGANITSIAKQAFDYFGSTGKKIWKQARPIFSATGSPTVTMGMDTDYANGLSFNEVTFTPTTASLWGVAKWGVGLWGSGLQSFKTWVGLSGIGFCAALRMKCVSNNVEVHWQATDHIFEDGEGVM